MTLPDLDERNHKSAVYRAIGTPKMVNVLWWHYATKDGMAYMLLLRAQEQKPGFDPRGPEPKWLKARTGDGATVWAAELPMLFSAADLKSKFQRLRGVNIDPRDEEKLRRHAAKAWRFDL
jgi:hypothetical protein